jgi:Tfp pilus assembly protein FimV
MSRTRVRRRRCTLTLVVLALTAFLVGPVSHALVAGASLRHEEPRRAYVVRPGDTLFAIASRQVADGADPRPLVDAIEAANDVEPADLVPGTVLVIPAA